MPRSLNWLDIHQNQIEDIGNYFDKEDELETQHELYHKNENHICDKCDADFDEGDALEMHEELYHENEYKCNICEYETTTQRGVNIHKGSKHK